MLYKDVESANMILFQSHNCLNPNWLSLTDSLGKTVSNSVDPVPPTKSDGKDAASDDTSDRILPEMNRTMLYLRMTFLIGIQSRLQASIQQ